MDISALRERLQETLGINELNALQHEMLEVATKHPDLLLLAPTGSGKTLGFLLPLLAEITPGTAFQACILCPTRELALQTHDVLQRLKTGLRSVVLYGGNSFEREAQQLGLAPEIIIGTPGRIGDHLRRGRINLGAVQTFVADEYDKILEFGFADQLDELLKEMNPARSWYVSATSPERKFPGRQPKVIDHRSGELAPEISVFKVETATKEKFFVLADLLCNLPTLPTVIFCNHREMTERIAEFLEKEGIICIAYHGGMEQDERERALIRFRNGSANYLVCTDLGARGLDIPDIFHVIHYQLPDSEETFTHRNGRTARAEKSGEVYMLVAQEEYLPEYVALSGTFVPEANAPLPDPPAMETIYLGGGKKDKISKGDVLGFLVANSELTASEVGMITIMDRHTFVAIPRDEVIDTMKAVWDKKIKGKRVKIARAR